MFQLSTSATTTTVTITGDLDLAARTSFPGVLARLAGLCPTEVVVDLCATPYVDSTGAAFLRSLADLARRRGGRAVVRGATDQVLFVLEVCGALEGCTVQTGHCCRTEEHGPWHRGVPAEPGSGTAS
jgi:anti-anti-sigma factor